MKQGLWIPREVLLLEDINLTEKAVLSSVLNFARKSGICTARNSTIASSLGVSVSTVEHEIVKLIKAGYISSTGRGPNRDLRIQQILQNNSADSTELISKSYRVNPQTLQNNSANLTEFPKEDKREDKREDKGEIMSLRDNPPHGDLKIGGLKNDQRTDEEDSDEVQSDFERFFDELLGG